MRFLLRPLLFCLVLLPTIVFYGCTPQPKPTVYLSEDFKAYTDFAVGSWWVYENVTNPSQRDSFYVIKTGQRIMGPGRGMDQQYNYEERSYRVVKKSGVELDTIGFSSFPPPAVNLSNPRFAYYLYDNKLGLTGLEVFFSPGQVGDSSSYEYGPRIVDRRETLLVKGKHYPQTITTKFVHSVFGNSIKSETYAKGVGVVRREYFDGRVFELVNHYIEQ